MKTICYIITFAFVLLSLSSCNHYNIGVDASDEEPGYNAVLLYRGDTIMCSPSNTNQEEFTGKCFHYHEGDSVRTEFLLSRSWRYATIIKGHIVDYSRNDDYLLIDQKPIDSILGEYITHYYDDGSFWYEMREYDTIGNYKKKMKMIEDSPIHQYWILNIKTADVWGPFSYEKYLDMKKQLGIPPTLMLKAEKYRGRND